MYVIANLKGHEDEFDALVFSCGDAVPVFQQYANQPYIFLSILSGIISMLL